MGVQIRLAHQLYNDIQYFLNSATGRTVFEPKLFIKKDILFILRPYSRIAGYISYQSNELHVSELQIHWIFLERKNIIDSSGSFCNHCWYMSVPGKVRDARIRVASCAILVMCLSAAKYELILWNNFFFFKFVKTVNIILQLLLCYWGYVSVLGKVWVARIRVANSSDHH